MNCVCTSISDMNIIKLNGKKSSQIAKEYGVSIARVNWWAKEHDVQCLSFDGGKTVECYVFDEAAEEQFANRPKESSGRPPVPKPPKVPGKPGRPRKHPVKALDIVPKRKSSGRGRPRKGK